jgi:tetrahydromethanopterin S-methyltransferase subunit A
MSEGPGFQYDDRGFFIIIVDHDKKKIVVEHYEYVKDNNRIKTGKIKNTFEGTDAFELRDEIMKKSLMSRLDHAFYLGVELGKAELALKEGLEYTQDDEIRVVK